MNNMSEAFSLCGVFFIHLLGRAIVIGGIRVWR
jgi:hypothetical protein